MNKWCLLSSQCLQREKRERNSTKMSMHPKLPWQAMCASWMSTVRKYVLKIQICHFMRSPRSLVLCGVNFPPVKSRWASLVTCGLTSPHAHACHTHNQKQMSVLVTCGLATPPRLSHTQSKANECSCYMWTCLSPRPRLSHTQSKANECSCYMWTCHSPTLATHTIKSKWVFLLHVDLPLPTPTLVTHTIKSKWVFLLHVDLPLPTPALVTHTIKSKWVFLLHVDLPLPHACHTHNQKQMSVLVTCGLATPPRLSHTQSKANECSCYMWTCHSPTLATHTIKSKWVFLLHVDLPLPHTCHTHNQKQMSVLVTCGLATPPHLPHTQSKANECSCYMWTSLVEILDRILHKILQDPNRILNRILCRILCRIENRIL